MTHHKMRHYLFQRSLPFTGCTWTRTTIWTELACILVICLLSMHQRNCTATSRIFTREHHITRHFFHSQITNVTCALSDYLWLFTILKISTTISVKGKVAYLADPCMWGSRRVLVGNLCKRDARFDIVRSVEARSRNKQGTQRDLPNRWNYSKQIPSTRRYLLSPCLAYPCWYLAGTLCLLGYVSKFASLIQITRTTVFVCFLRSWCVSAIVTHFCCMCS